MSNQKFVQACIQFLNEVKDDEANKILGENEELLFQNPASLEVDFVKLLSKLIAKSDHLKAEVLKSLNFSILSGEYIFDEPFLRALFEIRTLVTDIAQNVETEFLRLTGDNPDLEIEKVNDNFQKQFTGPIQDATKLCQWITSQIVEKTKNWSAIHIDLNPLPIVKALEGESGGEEVVTPEIDMAVNVSVAYLDHELEVNKSQIQQLLRLHNRLGTEETEQPLYRKLVRNKCRFLIYKIVKRIQRDDTPLRFFPEGDPVDLIHWSGRINYFSPFLEVVENHYRQPINDLELPFQNRKAIIRETVEKWEQGKELTYTDFHILIKNFKDYEKDINKLKYVVEQFFEAAQTDLAVNTIDFDKNAARKAQHYALNNLLSISIEQKIVLNHNLIARIDRLQEETLSKNYFPHYYFAKSIVASIEEELKKSTPDLVAVEQSLIELKERFRKYEAATRWSHEHNLLTFRLPFKECLIPIEGEEVEIDVFLASAFILPLDFKVIKLQEYDLRQKIQLLDAAAELKKTWAPEQLRLTTAVGDLADTRKELIQQKESVDTKLSEHDRKQIEILSIFAAIVLFVAGNVKVYESVKTAAEGALVLLSFAYALGLFVILIWLITRRHPIPISLKQNPALVAVGLIFSGMTWFLIDQTLDQKSFPIRERTTSNSDTLNVRITQNPDSTNILRPTENLPK